MRTPLDIINDIRSTYETYGKTSHGINLIMELIDKLEEVLS